VTAADFCQLVVDYQGQRIQHRQEHRRVAARLRRDLMHQAREAAQRVEEEFVLLRFPSELCSDDGRAVNGSEPDWPKTLRGETAEIYLAWEAGSEAERVPAQRPDTRFSRRNAR
jgi:hypothetical protein